MSGIEEQTFTVVDDNGILALVDCAAYASFVSEAWTYEGLLAHLSSEMAKKSILVWECGDGGGAYRVAVRRGLSDRRGFREAVGAIIVTDERINIASYTALTMAAQFDDIRLPEKHEQDLVFAASASSLKVRIVQMYDPAAPEGPGDLEPHFLVEIEPGDHAAWTKPAWETASATNWVEADADQARQGGLLDRIARIFS